MADILPSSGAPPSNGKPAPFRGTGAPNPSGSPSGIRGPRMIMQERAAREARQRAEAEQLERQRAEEARLQEARQQEARNQELRQQEARQEEARQQQAQLEARAQEEARRRDAERRAAGVAAGQEPASGIQYGTPQRQGPAVSEPQTSRQRVPTTSQPPQQRPSRATAVPTTTQSIPPQTSTAPVPVTTQAPVSGTQAGETTTAPATAGTSKATRNSFPHAFERWETLSAHWEGLTSYWIRKLEQNKDEISRDPINQQLTRQVTDLSAAGANLFHAVVELQRLRASSERKFQRWFFETRAELERAQEVNAMMEAALEQERQGRSNAIREAVENERDNSNAQKQLTQMRKELSISKEEARRAWEELGRREQEERDRTLSLQSGQPTIVGGVQVVPMTQGAPSRHASHRQYQPVEYTHYAAPEPPASTQTQPPAVPTVSHDAYLQPGTSSYAPARSSGGYSDGEYMIDAHGNFVLDDQGRKIPFAAPPSTYSGSDVEGEDYDTPATTNPPSGGKEPPSSGAGGQWSGNYPEAQDYTGAGYGAPGWETVPRHHHPTRLSDVIEEEDERSRTSASHSRV